MRILPRLHIPRFRSFSRALRRMAKHLTVSRVTLLVELMLAAALLWFALTGSRAAWLDQRGRRADALVIAALLVVFGWLHLLIRRHIVPWIELKFSPPVYDELRILLDLGQEARGATDLDQLYQSIAGKIGDALKTENVSIFVRDEASGDFVCRICWPPAPQVADAQGGEDGVGRPHLLLAREAFVVRRLQHLSMPLVVERQDYDVWERSLAGVARETKAARMRELESLRRIKANLLLHIKIKDQLVGILAVGTRPRGHQYSASDKEMLMGIAAQLAFVVENSKLLERIVAEERLRRELELAAKVQQRLFPERPPDSNSVELSGICHPARGVGGDYYDFLTFDNQQIGIAVADVAGKGISAALLMSTVQASLRSQVLSHNEVTKGQDSLAGLVSNLNLLLCRATGGANYVTFFYAEFDERTRQLTYVNAGHNPPFVLRRRQGEQDWLTLSTGGLFIGAFDHLQYEQETVALQSGDVLVAYTDGVTEAMSAKGDEFGEDRLQEALAEFADLSAEEMRERVEQRVREWSAGAPQSDDLTFIVLKVL